MDSAENLNRDGMTLTWKVLSIEFRMTGVIVGG